MRTLMRIDPPPAVLRLLLLFLITTQHEAKITTLHEASNKPYWPEDLRDIHSAALPRESPFRLPDAVLDICGAAERHRDVQPVQQEREAGPGREAALQEDTTSARKYRRT